MFPNDCEKLAPDAPSRPVIAVIPFDNMSGDPEQEYFADGITEDIITRLAQFPDILVLGRNTTFQFKGQAVDIKTIAEKLGADYVVEGSIRRGGGTVRVTAQLLGGESWTHLWAETYDRVLDPENAFAIQDEITQSVAARVGDPHGAISRAEYERSSRQPLRRMSSYDCVLRYYQHVRQSSPETHLAARECLQEAVATEPDNGSVMALLADIYLEEIFVPFNPTDESSLERTHDTALKAVRLAPDDGGAHAVLARSSLFIGDTRRANREAEEAVRLAPYNSDVIGGAILALANTGEYERAEALMKRLSQINPNYPNWINWNKAKFHFIRREYDQALTSLERTGQDWWWGTHLWIASAHCSMGEIDIGAAAIDKALTLNPNSGEDFWIVSHFWHEGPGMYPLYEIIVAGLEACGWDVPPDPGPEAFATAQ